MKTGILMILLVMGDGGQIESSFSEQEDMETCSGMSAGIREVFKETGTQIVKLDCVTTDLKFTKFSHDVPEDATRYHYMVDYRSKSPMVTKYPNQKACIQNISKKDKNKILCTSSTQTFLKH